MGKRLFIGTMLQPSSAKQMAEMRVKLEPLFEEWWQCRLRWVKPAKLHTTWLFLGDCNEESEAELRAILGQLPAELKSTELIYDRLQLFGDKSHPSALVLLPENIPSEVTTIAKFMKKELAPFCQKKDERPFQPHLTLLRFPREKSAKRKMGRLSDLSDYLPLKQTIADISLIESHTGESSEEYRILARHNLSD